MLEQNLSCLFPKGLLLFKLVRLLWSLMIKEYVEITSCSVEQSSCLVEKQLSK